MMTDPTNPTSDPATVSRYLPAPAPHPFDPCGSRVPYGGQTTMRLTIASGLANARIVIDPAARNLLAIECGDGPLPRIRLAGEDLTLTWRLWFCDWLRHVFTPGPDDVVIVLHPAAAWSVAFLGGLSRVELDLSAGRVPRIDIAGGCSEVLFDLPPAAAVVPIRISGGASHLGIRRPAQTGIGLCVAGGISMLRLDDQSLEAIGGTAQLNTGDVRRGVPHYQLTIAGGSSDLSIERR